MPQRSGEDGTTFWDTASAFVKAFLHLLAGEGICGRERRLSPLPNNLSGPFRRAPPRRFERCTMRASSHLKSSRLEPTERTTSICTSFGMDINESSDSRLVRRFAGISSYGGLVMPEWNTV